MQLHTSIAAPVERVFDLARSVDAHLASAGLSAERVVQGREVGLLEKDEEITWEGVHFGIRQRLCVKIVGLQKPTFFRDTMTKGMFSGFTHSHYFRFENGVTIMTDDIDYEVPFGVAGKIFDWLVLSNYLQRFIADRNRFLKETAESDQWKRFLQEP